MNGTGTGNGNGNGTNNGPLLTLRAALILLLGTLTGIGAGILTWLGGASPAQAVLAGAGASAPAVTFFDALIG
ncbi:hypothetical protein [Streptomyces cinnamoneus]|uniref:Uncharacterized protein n=1 Tax=Streptomyces cinnamoneus TaxID=53446 RepID=A0A918U219_STRCJ|nr:hypothetical protein [Streptomyces cinnamoneus]GHC66863.1 hypothetical protein GCM10010507_50890 [Streptomyces cinnamoneus]